MKVTLKLVPHLNVWKKEKQLLYSPTDKAVLHTHNIEIC
jgi:hypothetical protein